MKWSFICASWMTIALAHTGFAQRSESQPNKALLFGAGVSVPVLGAQDLRTAFYLAYQWTKPEKRLTINHIPLKLVLEADLGFSYGGGWRSRPRDKSWSISAMAAARYEKIGPSGRGFFFEGGMGIFMATRRTWDLSSNLNSTPTAGGGWIFPGDGRVYQVGLRLYHISNAGTRRPNQGQNQLLMMAGVRF